MFGARRKAVAPSQNCVRSVCRKNLDSLAPTPRDVYWGSHTTHAALWTPFLPKRKAVGSACLGSPFSVMVTGKVLQLHSEVRMKHLFRVLLFFLVRMPKLMNFLSSAAAPRTSPPCHNFQIFSKTSLLAIDRINEILSVIKASAMKGTHIQGPRLVAGITSSVWRKFPGSQ
jgi:hypothetical protein